MTGDDSTTVDLLVVGLGAAGAATAITAARAGLDVLVMEKQMPETHTPNVRLSGGKVMVARDEDEAARYLDACAAGLVPEAVSAAWARRATVLETWLPAVSGVSWVHAGGAEHPDLPGAAGVRVIAPGQDGRLMSRVDGRGAALFAGLLDTVRASGCSLRFGVVPRRLLRDGRAVVGVEVAGDGGASRITARCGVVLACGGFEFDDELKADNLPVSPMYFYGNPGNTGDGVRLAQEVGAGLWHMNQAVGRGIGSFELPGGGRLNFMIFLGPPGYVVTDRYGNRFADESGQAALRHDFYHHLLHYDVGRHEHPRIPAYWFFDERRRLAGPLTNNGVGLASAGVYVWSDDNQAEIDRGWIATGETVADAARAAGLADPEQAARVVAEYNTRCADGAVDPYGRPADTMQALDTPPFYCVRLWPGGSHTTGGPRRDQDGQVLDAFGESIPGLHAAGELGSGTGRLYPAPGASLSEAFCSGQAAAEHAAAVGPLW